MQRSYFAGASIVTVNTTFDEITPGMSATSHCGFTEKRNGWPPRARTTPTWKPNGIDTHPPPFQS